MSERLTGRTHATYVLVDLTGRKQYLAYKSLCGVVGRPRTSPRRELVTCPRCLALLDEAKP